MKQKFLSEDEWNRKMRELHQFYIYLEYILFAFRAKLDRLQESMWRRLAAEGHGLEACLDELVMEEEGCRWRGIEARGLEE